MFISYKITFMLLHLTKIYINILVPISARNDKEDTFS